ncbi:MAG: BamA/TamA family outer membrane protein [Merismopedia sp. SIO2A8]|nr:BamA/TamA family outer membrane protein [Merismopedia sp. SIO2A8]
MVLAHKQMKWIGVAVTAVSAATGALVTGITFTAPSWAIPPGNVTSETMPDMLIDDAIIDEAIDEVIIDDVGDEVSDEAIIDEAIGKAIIDEVSDRMVDRVDDVTIAQRMSEFGSDTEVVDVPAGNGERLTDIRVQFVDNGVPVDGRTRSFIITREFDLEPGDIYDAALAEMGLQRVVSLDIVRDASLSLEPVGDGEAIMVVTVDERTPFPVAFGLTLPHPTALTGPTEPATVLPGTQRQGGLSNGIQFQLTNPLGYNQTLALGIEGGESVASFDVNFTNPWVGDNNNRIGYAVNMFNRREAQTVFDGGDDEVDLPNDEDPWVHRIGGGVEIFRSYTPHLAAATGLSYQRVSIRDDAFSDDIFSEDELGNDLSFSGEGRDDLLTWSVASSWDRRDDHTYPTRGHRLLLRSDQFIPIGEANVFSNRLMGNFTQFVPFSVFGFDEGPRTLVLNVQGGTVIGDLPPYESFSLGGASSVRGYENGEVGSGRSFVQATAEYRFPIFDFTAFKEDIDVGGALFIDYANDLGSGDTVLGEPAEVRDKPGDGFGFGAGLRLRTPVGPVRLEFGLADDGDSQVIFKIGDRF